MDVAQPDVGSCGGITAARDIIAMAHANGVSVNPHVWGSAIAQAASLQLLAVIPETHHSLYPKQPLLEFDCSSHPFRNQLTTTPLALNNGVVNIPDGHGLGINVVEETVEQYRCQ